MIEFSSSVAHLSKGVCPVMHDRACVVFCPKMINLPQVVLEEVELHPRLDVGPVDRDVVVPVRPALLVPEPGCMHQFMHYNA